MARRTRRPAGQSNRPHGAPPRKRPGAIWASVRSRAPCSWGEQSRRPRWRRRAVGSRLNRSPRRGGRFAPIGAIWAGPPMWPLNGKCGSRPLGGGGSVGPGARTRKERRPQTGQLLAAALNRISPANARDACSDAPVSKRPNRHAVAGRAADLLSQRLGRHRLLVISARTTNIGAPSAIRQNPRVAGHPPARLRKAPDRD